MFLHLGADIVIPKKDVIMIIDIRTKRSSVTREFLQISEDEGFTKVIAEKVKSVVITSKNVYMSPISCATLKKRAENIFESIK
ncbi:conserved hypothetical protein [Desulfofarcimen acetoxidans DSM 771]|uniref:DUF370 domain-containing protein n=1 Tax=Desulfofarcimen acetoxidans (strain ATCC 49208 / DSM 771 / KCTC 5769 / VKM B-1644 / 5575) TaxID=485916 RepID=C8VVA1_DESAS|nr:extracellular matrix/biofilm biosynthesis regulator RemA family protein [Desulfofarcimen acetoxidans]ACV60970.1 conserved hypothetical protein [Desulfofarcimen acetoxidans DSM 771]